TDSRPTRASSRTRVACRCRPCGPGCDVRSRRRTTSPGRRLCCTRFHTTWAHTAFPRRRFTLTPGNNQSSAWWRDRPVFVTGATGLVGGWLVRRLVALGADVVCLVRDWIPGSELVASGTIEHVRVVRGDVRHQPTLERALGEYEIATVFHLAAQ